jgi:hypothetical protein
MVLFARLPRTYGQYRTSIFFIPQPCALGRVEIQGSVGWLAIQGAYPPCDLCSNQAYHLSPRILSTGRCFRGWLIDFVIDWSDSPSGHVTRRGNNTILYLWNRRTRSPLFGLIVMIPRLARIKGSIAQPEIKLAGMLKYKELWIHLLQQARLIIGCWLL